MLEMTGDLDRALELRSAELSLVTQLVARDPANTTWQRNFALTQMSYGVVLRLKGRSDAALTAMKGAQETMQRLLSRPETVPSWRRDLGNIRTATAKVYLALGNVSQAQREAKSAVELLEPFVGKDALMPRYIGEAWLTLGDAYAASGDSSHARAAWTTALQILAPLARDSQIPEVLDIKARTLLRLGQRDEAAPLIERLQRSGYRAPDFVRASS
jgi:tetratricopeptide (TPR) repeat protein